MDDELARGGATGPGPRPAAAPPDDGEPPTADRRGPDPAGSLRGPLSLLGLGIVLFLLAIGGWWAQDAVGTVANVGEADIGESITFTADGGDYRLLSSGPLRPAAESTYCELTWADGSSRTEVGGQGLQAARLGVDRLLTFTPPAGETTVRCTNRRSDTVGNGRFQVLEADGPVRLVLIGVITASLASLAVAALWGTRTYRHSAAAGAGDGGSTGATGRPDRLARSPWGAGIFDVGGHPDDDEPDTSPEDHP